VAGAGPAAVPGIADVLIVYAAMLLYSYSLGGFFARLSPFGGMVLFTLGIGIAPVAYAMARGMSFRRTFPLCRPSSGAALGSVTLTVGLVFLVLAATGILLAFMPSGIPGGEDMSEALGALPAWEAAIAVGLLPALCEEILFRGFILSGLGAMTGKWRAIALTAVLFGVLHRDPARIPLTGAVGLALGYVAWETRSLILPAVMHGLYNLSLVFLSRIAASALETGATEGVTPVIPTIPGGSPGGLSVLTVFSAIMPLVPFAFVGAFLVRRGAARIKKAEAGRSDASVYSRRHGPLAGGMVREPRNIPGYGPQNMPDDAGVSGPEVALDSAPGALDPDGGPDGLTSRPYRE